ncbi:hypothetical protein JCM8097_005976 [Rhodosporidiobolus ruineniae]
MSILQVLLHLWTTFRLFAVYTWVGMSSSDESEQVFAVFVAFLGAPGVAQLLSFLDWKRSRTCSVLSSAIVVALLVTDLCLLYTGRSTLHGPHEYAHMFDPLPSKASAIQHLWLGVLVPVAIHAAVGLLYQIAVILVALGLAAYVLLSPLVFLLSVAAVVSLELLRDSTRRGHPLSYTELARRRAAIRRREAQLVDRTWNLVDRTSAALDRAVALLGAGQDDFLASLELPALLEVWTAYLRLSRVPHHEAFEYLSSAAGARPPWNKKHDYPSLESAAYDVLADRVDDFAAQGRVTLRPSYSHAVKSVAYALFNRLAGSPKGSTFHRFRRDFLLLFAIPCPVYKYRYYLSHRLLAFIKPESAFPTPPDFAPVKKQLFRTLDRMDAANFDPFQVAHLLNVYLYLPQITSEAREAEEDLNEKILDAVLGWKASKEAMKRLLGSRRLKTE